MAKKKSQQAEQPTPEEAAPVEATEPTPEEAAPVEATEPTPEEAAPVEATEPTPEEAAPVEATEPTPEEAAPVVEQVPPPVPSPRHVREPSIELRMMRMLRENTSGLPAALIAHRLDTSLSRVLGTMNGLVESGSVRSIAQGVYQVTPRGLEQLGRVEALSGG